MTSCIIIEDEPLASQKLTDYLEKLPNFNLLESFNSAVNALDFLNQTSVDLIFLDIEMKDLNGIQFLEAINIKSKVIITTAYEKYAIKGFELQVSDYLLKPISFSRFIQACNKVLGELNRNQEQSKNSKIFVKTEYRLEGIEISDILYIEGMGDYRRIVTIPKKIMTLQTFKELSNILPKEDFCRVHKSYIVSIDKIDKIERNRIYIKEEIIPISDSYNSAFYDRIKMR